MKKMLFSTLALVLTVGTAMAQNLDLGVKYYNYERYKSAETQLAPIVNNDQQANYYYGLSQIGLEDYGGAKTTFDRDQTNYFNQAGTARILFQQGKAADAEKILDAIVDKAKKKEWQKYQVAADAITYTDGGDVNKAIGWYQKAINQQSNNVSLLIGLGDAYLKLEDGGGNAMDNYEAALKIGKDSSLVYSRIGYLWYVAKNYTDALTNYGKAKDADPDNPLPYRDLAMAYQRAGNYKMALENDSLYLLHTDQNINDQINYANILYLAKKYPEAKEKMETLIQSGNARPYMYRIVGYTSYETKDYQGALDNMNLFFQKETDTTKLISDDYLYYGKIYAALAGQDSVHAATDIQKAESNFQKAINMDTAAEDQLNMMHQIADGYKDAKIYDKAGSWYGKIIAKNPEAPALDYYYWGFWNFYGQNLQEAQKAFTEMADKYPTEGSAFFWIARVKAAQDSKAETGLAVDAYKKWLDFEADGYKKDDQQKMQAYQYLAYYYYNKKDAANATSWCDKIIALDPNNEFAKSVINYFKETKKG